MCRHSATVARPQVEDQVVFAAHAGFSFHGSAPAQDDPQVVGLLRDAELSAKEARARVHQEDLGRRRYFKRYFNKNDNDPLLYHLVINTGLVSLDDAARIIGDVVLQRPAPVLSEPPALSSELVLG